MEEVLQVLIAVGGLFIVIGFTADSIAGAAIRRKIADKDLPPEKIEALLKRRTDPDSVLKWALLATGVGIGFLLLQFLPADVQDEPIVVGLVLVFAGAALFLYRAMIRRQSSS
jgi:hypothetical protein